MKAWEIFRFEIGSQLRRLSTWFYFGVLLVLTYLLVNAIYVESATRGGYHFNAPLVIASITVFGTIMALLPAAALAGGAGAADVQTRMHPFVYAMPMSRAAYVGGRFLAAFCLAALLLTAVPAALLIAAFVPGPLPGPGPELLGSFRPAAYLDAYLFIALPNAFVATALGFCVALLGRRSTAGYLAGALLFFTTVLCWQLVAEKLGHWELAKLLDPMGLTSMAELSKAWTAAEKNARLVGLHGSLLYNRLLWLGIAASLVGITARRFRLASPAAGGRARVESEAGTVRRPMRVPRVARSFGAATHARQVAVVAGEAFRTIVTSWGGPALAVLLLILVLTGRSMAQHLGVPLYPATGYITGFIGGTDEILWMIVPVLVIYYAGELVWRERDAGLSEISDAAPAPDWVSLLGKFLGLATVLVAAQALLVPACMLVQAAQGYHRFEIGLYARILLGIQLVDLLLFALLALAVQVMVDRKYVGHLVVLAAFGFMSFGPSLGVEHNLLVFRSDPGWTYSDMRGFGPFTAPWVWFKLYWAAWALLLAVGSRVMWARGAEQEPAARLRLARSRLTRGVAGATLVAVMLILSLGGFIFYNTNVLNRYETAADGTERSAAYERRFGRFAGAPQPRLVGTALRVEIHPERRRVEIDGTYALVNATGGAIDTVHVAPDGRVETGAVSFDRPATEVVRDDALGHRIYALATPLQPGDTLRMRFSVRFAPRGFPNRGIDPSVSARATYFDNGWLPAIGYQQDRELDDAGARAAHGLPARPAIPGAADAAALKDVVRAGAQLTTVDVVVGTAAGQTAVAPGELRRAWTERGRRYFHYTAGIPIRNDFAIYSAAYAVRNARWTAPSGQVVDIQVLHHPAHRYNVDRMIRGVQASLDYNTRWFGPYPQRQIRLVERPGFTPDLHGSPINMWYREEFALFRPEADSRGIDFPFAVVAHEVGHQWWGNQVMPAYAEGAALVSESLAWYSAMGAVEQTYGRAHLDRLLAMMREIYVNPRSRGAVPLLRATDRFQAYRKGPFAMFALREYVGEARVNAALRRVVRAHGSGAPPLATSLDVYRELAAVTPDSLRWLLHDLFEANTWWEMETRAVRAEPAGAGQWRVTLEVKARKVVVDTAGAEREVPMSDQAEIGVFAGARDGGPGQPLYLRMHRIRSGEQRVTVVVSRRPARAGIDPRNLLIDAEPGDNLAEVAEGDGKRR